ncbi:MAG: ASCH domain-containing protein [Methanomicrobia archaeon]|nr:ASCH domain-containing protein [Methanomicrobia archaeon]
MNVRDIQIRELPSLFEVEESEQILLFSIKPEFSELILSGKKTVELRKQVPKKKSRYAIIYESSPSKGITGLFVIKSIQVKPIREISRLLSEACVSSQFLGEYYRGYNKGVVIEIENAFRFERKMSLYALRELMDFAPPQDFCYFDVNLVQEVLR